MSIKARGHSVQQKVAQLLAARGYKIRAQNYYKPYGEIDIIAQKDDTVSFIEVKYRKNPLFDMATIITPAKQKKMILVAKEYSARHNLNNHIIQFDVVLIAQYHDTTEIKHIENAFQGS